MMVRGTSGLVVALLAAFGLVASAAGLQYVREQKYPRPVVSEETLFITSGTALRRMTSGYNALAADLYWIRAIQYYGGTRQRLSAVPSSLLSPDTKSSAYELLYPLLDLTTTLDPRFNIAYRFGSMFLSAKFPDGAGQPDLAVRLLEKGLREQPQKWEYMHDIGFVYYWDVHDYIKAAEYFNRAADIQGAPWWMRGMAATTLARGGQRSASRTLWQYLYDSADNEGMRQAAALKLLQLTALDQIEDLQKRVDAFAERRPELPRSWQTLVAAGVLPGVPLDPGGTAYELSESGRVMLSMKSTLFPLPLEPGSRAGTG